MIPVYLCDDEPAVSILLKKLGYWHCSEGESGVYCK